MIDPLHPVTRALRKISSKRKKTEADYEQMAKLEFIGGLYLMNSEPCLPGELMEAAFLASAKKNRMGEQAKAGLICDDNFPLEYDGPRKPEEMWEDERFRFVKAVRIQRNKIIRTRPIFREWAATVSFDYLPTMLNDSDIHDTVARLGMEVGIGDWRPKFGRFRAEVI